MVEWDTASEVGVLEWEWGTIRLIFLSIGKT
jgi:hypothetical protein